MPNPAQQCRCGAPATVLRIDNPTGDRAYTCDVHYFSIDETTYRLADLPDGEVPPPPDRVALSVDQAAERAGVSPKTIRRALADGRLVGAWKVGVRWKIPPDALDGLKERPSQAIPVPPKATRRPAQPQTYGDRWEA